MENFPVLKIEQKQVQFTEKITEPKYEPTPASTALELGALTMRMARVERTPRYDEKTRENNAEHSYMLALIAPELAELLFPGRFDLGLISQYCIAHDLIETKTGDVATFHFSAEDMANKHLIEQAALEELLTELPPHTARILREYEEQKTPESRWTKGCDKLLPKIVDILGPGKKVMGEDYGVTTQDQLVTSHTKLHNRIAKSFEEFQPIVETHGLLCELFELEFEATQE